MHFLRTEQIRAEAIFGHGVIVRVLVNQIHLVNERAQELARHHADIALEALRHLGDQPFDKGGTHLAVDLPVISGRVKFTEAQGHRPQPLSVKRQEFKLGLAQAGETPLLEKANAFMQGRKAGDTVPAVKELRCAGKEPEQTRVGTGGIGNLADAVE